MKSLRRIFLASLFVVSVVGNAAPHRDNYGREFLVSCSYGVLSGTLVGAASLAFTKRPGNHLNKVARGASLGLYMGILLGLYIVYIVPGMQPAPQDQNPLLGSRLQLAPTFGPNGLDGARAQLNLLDF